MKDSFVTMQWGDVATWLASVGSISAVIVALWLAFKEGKIREARERDEAAAAARVVISTAALRFELREEDEQGGPFRSARPVADVLITNYGHEPVLAVEVTSVHGTDIVTNAYGKFAVEGSPSPEAAIIGPGVTKTIVVRLREDQFGSGQIDRLTDIQASAVISFVDSHGRRWTRWAAVAPRRNVATPVVIREPPNGRITPQ